MGATDARHALIFRANGLAPAGVMGVWLLAGMLGTGPARADDQGAKPVPPAPVPMPMPVARKTHGPYLFFLPGGRTTHRPAAEPAAVALVQRPARPPYMYFAPGKRTPAPPPIGPVARPIPPDVPPPLAPRLPAAKEEGIAGIPPPRPVKHQTLIFFTPKRDMGAKDRPPREDLPPLPLPPLPPNARRPNIEPIPVRVPGGQARKPQPYLILQPKDARARPGAPPVEKGTSPSATSEWSNLERIAAIDLEAPLPSRPAAPQRAGGAPAPPTYRVVVENRLRPAAIPPLVPAAIDLEASAEPPVPPTLLFDDETGRGSERSSALPARLSADVVAQAARGPAVPSEPAPLPEPDPTGPEPIRLTGATAETPVDIPLPRPPVGPPRPLGADHGASRQPR